MKLKRLIAITVVLTTLLSCSCIAGSTVLAADADTGDVILYHWDGMLKTLKKTDATVGTKYGRIAGGYTNNGEVVTDKAQQVAGIYNSGFTAALAYRPNAYNNSNAGTIATLQEGSNYYYEITHNNMRLESNKNVTVFDENFSLRTDVYSFSFDLRIPAASAKSSRPIFYQIHNNSLASNDANYDYVLNTFDYVYDEATDSGSLSYVVTNRKSKTHNAENSWANDVEIKPDTWYSIELRLAIDTDDNLVAAIYVEDEKVAFYEFNNHCFEIVSDDGSVANPLYLWRFWLSDADAKATYTVVDPAAHYDEIMVKVLDDYNTYSPRPVEPPVATDFVDYVVSNVETGISVAATIKGFSTVSGAAKCYLAIFNPANGRVSSVKINDVTIDEYADADRTVNATFDASAAAGTQVKVFFFNPTSLFVPVLPNFAGTIN